MLNGFHVELTLADHPTFRIGSADEQLRRCGSIALVSVDRSPRGRARIPIARSEMQQRCCLRLTVRVATARCLSAVQPGSRDGRAEGALDGKIKAPLRGVESAVVSFCVHSLQHGAAHRSVVLLETERPERSTSRMALIAAWRTASQNWDKLSHKRMEGRCRAPAGLALWLPSAYGLLRAVRCTDHEAKQPGQFAF
jgi:hypothetical protein